LSAFVNFAATINNRVVKFHILIIVPVLVVLLFSAVAGQGVRSVDKKANKYFSKAQQAYRKGDDRKAIVFLSKALKSDSAFTKAYLLLGDMANDKKHYSQAIKNYKNVVKIAPSFSPFIYYVLGKLYYRTGAYADAVDVLHYYLQNKPKEKHRAKMLWKRAHFAAAAIQSPLDVTINNTSDLINTQGDEYVNFVNENEQKMIFTRKTKTETEEGLSIYDEHFYSADKRNGKWNMPKTILFYWQNNHNLGAMSFSVDGRQMYFTGCYWPHGKGGCDLYLSNKRGEIWLEPHNLGIPVNTGHWESQAVISSDGKELYFASKRPEGYGGSDIYLSKRNINGQWGTPINLGTAINTTGNEMSPFLFADDQTLYFSSTGRLGLGGYDLFFSRRDTSGNWLPAKNLGYPVNTRFNEINLFINLNARHCWISSDRKNGLGGYDIYDFKTPAFFKPQNIFFIKGTVLNKKNHRPLAANILLTNLLTDNLSDSLRSDPVNGRFLSILHRGVNYAVNITKKGYLFLSDNIDLTEDTVFVNIEDTFFLQPVQKGSFTRLENIRFDFDKATLKKSSFPELRRLLSLLNNNPAIVIEISGHTDNVGGTDYNLQLSEQRALAVVNYLKQSGIASYRLHYRGFGATKPLCTDNTGNCHAKNRRTEITIISKTFKPNG